MTLYRWRQMLAEDLPVVCALANDVYPPEYWEDPPIFAAKLASYPKGCLCLETDGGVVGYCFAHSWTRRRLPLLNAVGDQVPATPDTYFIHDLAIARDHRGSGRGAAGLNLQIATARSSGLSNVSLVSVLNSEGFWQRMGFSATDDAAVQLEVRDKYGEGAVHMQRDL